MTIVLISMPLASCSRSPRLESTPLSTPSAHFGDNADLPPELARVLRDYEDAWQHKDASALADIFAENGFVLPSGSPPVRGRANIEKHYAGAGGPLALRAMAWANQGDVGYIIGEFARDDTFANPGKFTLTLVRDAHGRWLIMSDMDNGNTPPQQTTMPAATTAQEHHP